MGNKNADIRPSPRVGVETAAGQDDLWALHAAFLAQWAQGITVRTSWRTSIDRSRDLSESRMSLTDRPFRSFTLSLESLGQDDSIPLLSQVQRMATARMLMPLYSDHTKMDAASAPLDTIISADVSDRRFFPGQLILLIAPLILPITTWQPIFEVAQIERIDSVTKRLKLVSGLFSAFGAGTRVYPLVESKVVLRQRLRASTDEHVALALTFTEYEGYSALPRLETPGSNPAGFTVYDGLPIFNPDLNFRDVDLGLDRDGQFTRSGLGNILETQGDRARWSFDLPTLHLNRADAFKLLRFFDSRGGATFPFWILMPFNLYTPVAITTTSVTVTVAGPEIDWDTRPFIGFMLKDGTQYVREISGVVRAGITDVVSFADPLPTIALSDLRRVTLALKARFDSDELEEEWITDETMRTKLSVTELVSEQDVALANLDSIETDTDGLPSGDPSLGCQTRWVRFQGESNNPGWVDVDVYFPEEEFFIIRDTTNVPGGGHTFPQPFYFLWNGGRYRINTDGAGDITDNSIVDRIPEGGIFVRTEDLDIVELDDFTIDDAMDQAATPKEDLPPVVRVVNVLHSPAFDWDELCGTSPLDTPANVPPNDAFPWNEQLRIYNDGGKAGYEAYVHPPRYLTPITGDGFPSVEHPTFEIFEDPFVDILAPVTSGTDPDTGFTVEYEAWSKWFAFANVRSLFWTNVEDDDGRLLSKHVWELRIYFYRGAPASPDADYLGWVGRRFGLHPFGRFDLVDETTFENIILAEGLLGVHNCGLVNIGDTLTIEPDERLSELFNPL